MKLLIQNICAFLILKMISKLLSIENEHFMSIFPPAMYENAHFPFFLPSSSYTM